MQRAPSPDDALVRWRRDARAAMPGASDDLVDEVAQHLADRWQASLAAGLSVEAADGRAFRELEAWRSQARSFRWRLSRVWSGWRLEVRRAVRTWIRRPAAAAAIVLLTSIGVGAPVAAFTVAYGLLWRPLPYPEGDRLAVIWQVQQGEVGQVSYPDYHDLAEVSVFDGATALDSGTGTLRVDDRTERVNMLSLEPGGFSLLGVRPVLGRLLDAGDRGTANVLLSHRLWRRAFGENPDVLGRALWLSGRTFTVVGVVAPDVDFELPVGREFRLEREDLWSLFDPREGQAARRDVWTYEAVVRLKPGVDLDTAQRAVDAIGARLAADHPDTNSGRSFRLAWLADEMVRGYRRPLALAGAAALVAFLTALANILTIAGVRITECWQELAIRDALGAGALRIRRLLLTEDTILVMVGAAAGMGLARVAVSAIASSDAAHLPRVDAIRFDAPAYAVAALVALAVLAALASLPWRAGDIASALRTGGRASGGGQRARRRIVAGELALTLTLATGGALSGLSVSRLMAVDPGFVADGAVSVRVSAYAAQHAGRQEVVSFFDSLLGEIHTLPGVTQVGAGSSLPMGGQFSGASVVAEGQLADTPATRPTAGWQVVTPGYFAALGMSVREGRAFAPADVDRSLHVTIINETLARLLFGGEPAVGRRIGIGGDENGGDWHEVVGVVADTRHDGLAAAPGPRVYDLFGQHWSRTLFVVARAEGVDPGALVIPIRRIVTRLDSEAPVFQAARMLDLVRHSAAPFRLSAAMAITLALTALALALAGVYATAMVLVATRMKEVGIRAALGASRASLVGLVLRDGASTAAVGALLGCAGAAAAARLLASQLFGARASDAVTVVPLLAAALVAAATLATVPAALRAARVDPLATMRDE